MSFRSKQLPLFARFVFIEDRLESITLHRSTHFSFEIEGFCRDKGWVKTALSSYFVKKRPDCKKLLSSCSTFDALVYEATLHIPYGSTLSYGEVASIIGYPSHARQVGASLAKNRWPLLIPCHRVIRKDGTYGSYNQGDDLKETLLSYEMA